jgi:hypothetical protein
MNSDFLWRQAGPIRRFCVLAILGAAALAPVWGQSAPAKSAPPSGGSAPKTGQGDLQVNPDGSTSLGFSIESEMLTYRALESDSQAVACDIAAYLKGGAADFTRHPAGEVCDVKGGVNTKVNVVIVPFNGPLFQDFRLWRADMEIMSELRGRAAGYCPESNVITYQQRGSGVIATAPRGMEALTPAGSALTLTQNAIGLFASQTSTSPVGGTIQDQAFMDGVARELRALNVAALMPGTYPPHSLAAADASRSPFLSSLDKLLESRFCLAGLEVDGKTDTARVAQIKADIDSYLDALRGGAPAPSKPPASPPSNTTPPADTNKPGASTPEPSGVTVTSASSPLIGILSADDLAQKLGVDPATGKPAADSPWQHVLLLHALESGGTVAKTANILGSRIRYSGGAVGTYALFALDGELECSGNVYAYGGSALANKFQAELRRVTSDPSNQFIFQHGGCRPAEAH